MCTHATTRAALLLGAAFLGGCAGTKHTPVEIEPVPTEAQTEVPTDVPIETEVERAALASELVAGMRISVVTASGAVWEGELEEASKDGVRVWASRFSESILMKKEFRFQGGEMTDPALTILKLEAAPASNGQKLFEPLEIGTEAQRADLVRELGESNQQLVRLTTADGKERIAQVVSVIADGPGGIRGSYFSAELEQYLDQDFYFAGEPAKGPEVTITSLARVRPYARTPNRPVPSNSDSSADRVVPSNSDSNTKTSIAYMLIAVPVVIILAPVIIIGTILAVGLLF